MKIVAISDLHGYLPVLPAADIICVVGDITPAKHDKNAAAQWQWYNEYYLPWVESLPASKVITIAGNHDYCFLEHKPTATDKHIYLENSGVEIYGYTFYGVPNTRPAMRNHGFSMTHEELVEIFSAVPDKLDFLLAHSSPYGVNDCGMLGDGSEDLGNKEMTQALKDKDISYIFCGHIHTGNHTMGEWRGKKIVNVSYCKENKIPAYEPYILEIDKTAPYEKFVHYERPVDTKGKLWVEWIDINGKAFWIDWYKKISDTIEIKRLSQVSELPKEIVELIPKWEAEIERLKAEQYDLHYCVKGAHLDFIYNDKLYSLCAESLSSTTVIRTVKNIDGMTIEYMNTSHELFSGARSIIEKDLRTAGCIFISYTDFLD